MSRGAYVAELEYRGRMDYGRSAGEVAVKRVRRDPVAEARKAEYERYRRRVEIEDRIHRAPGGSAFLARMGKLGHHNALGIA